LDRTPDRRSLMQRGLDYTAESAAAQFLQIVTGLQPKPAFRVGSLAMTDMS
jgi:hypothetical protein